MPFHVSYDKFFKYSDWPLNREILESPEMLYLVANQYSWKICHMTREILA